MSESQPPNPMSRTKVIDEYFLDHRAKLLDIAAFLDRVDRASGDAAEDFRMRAFRAALALLDDGAPERARRVLESMSDPTTELIDVAPGKGACGTPPPPDGEHA
jgi:hypothetical protein